jgi:hypothetical protein
MRKFMIVAAVSLLAALVVAAPAPGAKSRALSGTQKIAAKVCAQSAGCTGWVASCRGPNSKRQWKCKATNYFDTSPTTCLIGLTWVQRGGKVVLTKYGKPQCYG